MTGRNAPVRVTRAGAAGIGAAGTSAVALAALTATVAVLTACGTARPSPRPVPKPGVVAGLASLCSGLPSSMLHPSPPALMVYVQHDGLRVASRALPGAGGRYRVVLTPGAYAVSVPRSADPPQSVTVRAGATVTANFPNGCK